MMKFQLIAFLLTFVSINLLALEPLVLKPGKLVFDDDFSNSEKFKKSKWQILQETQWSVKDGVLVGTAATAEYQAKREKLAGNHLGNVPLIRLRGMPNYCVFSFKLQMDDKPKSKKLPMIEFGHHIIRIHFTDKGATLFTAHEKKEHTFIKGFQLKPFKWYEVLAEIGKEDIVIQIKDDAGNITKFSGKDQGIQKAKNTDFRIGATVQGTVKLDDLKVWEMKGS